jgi:excisionase family DNA binding protein
VHVPARPGQSSGARDPFHKTKVDPRRAAYGRAAMATGPYLSKQNAARRLDVSTKTIDRLRAAGELESIRVGSRVRIKIASLEAYELRQAEREAQAEPADPFAIPALDTIRAEKVRRRAAAQAREEAA